VGVHTAVNLGSVAHALAEAVLNNGSGRLVTDTWCVGIGIPRPDQRLTITGQQLAVAAVQSLETASVIDSSVPGPCLT
jgi:hypothetical protein